MKILLASLLPWISVLQSHAESKPPATPPDVRISVKAVSEGTDRDKKSAVATRKLEVELQNREHRALEGLVMEWKIYGEDVRSNKKSVVEKGTESVTLEADQTKTITSNIASFEVKEGDIKVVGKGKNKHRAVERDSGKRYTGYTVVLKQGKSVVAEASTAGLGK